MEGEELSRLLEPLVGTLEDLTTGVTQMAHEVAVRDEATRVDLLERAEENRKATRQQARRTGVLGVLVALLLVGVGILCFSAITGRTILRTVESVTSPQARDQQAIGTADILRRNAIETDCRSRRQQVRLPAPQDAPPPPPEVKTASDLLRYLNHYSCVAQTDPSVYPGTPGEPSK